MNEADAVFVARLAGTWFFALLGWRLLHAGMVRLSQPAVRPGAAPAGMVVERSHAGTQPPLGTPAMILGAAILAPCILVMLRVPARIAASGAPLATLMVSAITLLAITITLGPASRLVRRKARAEGSVALGVGNMTIAGLVLGLSGWWLALRWDWSRNLLARVPGDLAAVTLSRSETTACLLGLACLLAGLGLQMRDRRRARAGFASGYDGVHPVAIWGLMLVLAGTVLVLAGLGGALTASWQAVTLGLLVLVSFVATLRGII
ncbi:MAG: hypothetical protein O3B22_02110 [Proteobacteria bacterium]|nr:hypothetical protein [Pseudomonadota bacterium]